MEIDVALVRRLIAVQFPRWSHASLHPVPCGGWDNRTFRLGEDMLVRLPSGASYAPQVAKEQYWLPRLAPLLPLPIPAPLALGVPTDAFPFPWSVYRWIDGVPAGAHPGLDQALLTQDLDHFLAALQRLDAEGGPPAGEHNCFRGGRLATYDSQTRAAMRALGDRIDASAVTSIWESALNSVWNRAPVWVHGDISPGNLLIRDGRLAAVIDFGCLGIGDPACDLAIAWTFLGQQARDLWRGASMLDQGTWQRGCGWALWKALITLANAPGVDVRQTDASRRTLREILASRAGAA